MRWQNGKPPIRKGVHVRIVSEERGNWIDLLKFNQRRAVNSVGAGFDGEGAEMTEVCQVNNIGP